MRGLTGSAGDLAGASGLMRSWLAYGSRRWEGPRGGRRQDEARRGALDFPGRQAPGTREGGETVVQDCEVRGVGEEQMPGSDKRWKCVRCPH